ncbi:MAG TPA: 50S ribosomal protein L22 [Candidatus Melainabacteria bacterium]|jgi:large subunit ribosomal protein L22|nr:MAG: 50S ribosomal protein L22 [Candidatus Melainabacteria bacterium]HIA54998.1 50S ribosomal protein L22 [Candidatus Melainabacteria bacterium]HIN63155.1 50S ribosomal protein L22 [Candidatus Obscuribacterales bacterium]
MQSKAHTKWLRMSPRKVRRVVDEIRGKSAADAVTMLRFMPYSAAREVEKVLKSAMYNRVHAAKNPISEDEAGDLKIVEVYADQGPTLKRIQPRARGRWYPILKRSSHITLVLSDV